MNTTGAFDNTNYLEACVRHLIMDYILFMIECRRFHDAFMNQNSPARNNRYAGEDIDKDKEKENKEKAGQRVPDGTRPAGDDALGPSRRTFSRWIKLHQPALTAMGIGPKVQLLPPWGVKYLSEKLDIDLPKRKFIKVRPES